MSLRLTLPKMKTLIRMSKKGWMYILECSDGSFYTGSTVNLERRISQHQNGEGANHTAKRLPVNLIYSEEFDHVAKAFYREKQIQRWSKAKKIALINNDFVKLKYLAMNTNKKKNLANSSENNKKDRTETQKNIKSNTVDLNEYVKKTITLGELVEPNIIGIVGIDTEVGKTIISAIVTEALKADYWKLLQAGDLHQLDSNTVKSLVSNTKTKFHKERYLLTEPMSPHAAANIDNIQINISDFELPNTKNTLIVEGAGGLMVPINEKGDMVVDLMSNLVDEVILVTKNYLGSINHTLMSVEILRQKNIKIKGLIFNGKTNPESERIIGKLTGLKIIAKVPFTNNITKEFVISQASNLAI